MKFTTLMYSVFFSLSFFACSFGQSGSFSLFNATSQPIYYTTGKAALQPQDFPGKGAFFYEYSPFKKIEPYTTKKTDAKKAASSPLELAPFPFTLFVTTQDPEKSKDRNPPGQRYIFTTTRGKNIYLQLQEKDTMLTLMPQECTFAAFGCTSSIGTSLGNNVIKDDIAAANKGMSQALNWPPNYYYVK